MTTETKPLDYYLKPWNTHIDIIADPDGGYVAVFPDLPGCMTQGETLEEVIYMAKEACERMARVRVRHEIPTTSLCPHTLR